MNVLKFLLLCPDKLAFYWKFSWNVLIFAFLMSRKKRENVLKCPEFSFVKLCVHYVCFFKETLIIWLVWLINCPKHGSKFWTIYRKHLKSNGIQIYFGYPFNSHSDFSIKNCHLYFRLRWGRVSTVLPIHKWSDLLLQTALDDEKLQICVWIVWILLKCCTMIIFVK